jgi:cell division transport system permease protein
MLFGKKLGLLPEQSANTAGGILPWVIGVMVYLSALALAGSIALRSATSEWTAGLAQSLTVQISEADRAIRTQQAEAAQRVLKSTPGILSARILNQKEMNALLEPWLGAGNVNPDLPIPTLIDVQLDPSGLLDQQALETTLKAAAPSASIDTHRQWLGELSTLTRSMEWIANLIVILIALATVAIVAFGTRAGLATHKPTIEILHLMGAEDTLIASEFQGRFLWYGLKGAVFGVLCAVATLGLLSVLASRLQEGLLSTLSLPPLGWVFLGVLPLLAALMTMVTARITVLRALKDYL